MKETATGIWADMVWLIVKAQGIRDDILQLMEQEEPPPPKKKRKRNSKRSNRKNIALLEASVAKRAKKESKSE